MWDSIESLGYTKLVAIGNPLRAEGGFVDLCNQALFDKIRGVPQIEATCYHNLPSTASPHSAWSKSPVGLADRTWLDACERKYGRDSLWFRCHIQAIRPSLVNEQLIPEEDLDRCVIRETRDLVAKLRQADKSEAGRPRLGCDVGEGCGNARTVVFVRDELGVLDFARIAVHKPNRYRRSHLSTCSQVGCEGCRHLIRRCGTDRKATRKCS